MLPLNALIALVVTCVVVPSIVVPTVLFLAPSSVSEPAVVPSGGPVSPLPGPVTPATQAPVTPAPATQAPETPAPATQVPVTPAPATPASVTPAPATPAPVTPAPATPAPVTPAPATPAPVTPVPILPPPPPSRSNKRGIWVNKDSALTEAGNLKGIPYDDIDFIILASYSPDPMYQNCTPSNSFGLMPGGVPLTLAKTIRGNMPSDFKSRILASVGGSSFGTMDFCNLVMPFITFLYPDLKNCSQTVGAALGGPCNSSQGFTAPDQTPGAYSTGQKVCVQNATTNTSWWENYFPGNVEGTTCAYKNKSTGVFTPSTECTCCCGYNFVYNETRHMNGGDPCQFYVDEAPPSRDYSCGTQWLGAGLSMNRTIDMMYFLLTSAQLDGLDFDFEAPDDRGYVGAGIVEFIRQLKAKYVMEGRVAPYISLTLFAGPSNGGPNGTVGEGGNEYSALFRCFQSSTCPIDAAVPMPYDNCMYQSSSTLVTKETYVNSAIGYVRDPYPDDQLTAHAGFTLDGLMTAWTGTYVSKNSSTELIVALSAIQHWNRFPCEFLVSDIEGLLRPDYMDVNNNETYAPIRGAFFWYYETPCATGPVGSITNQTDNSIIYSSFEYNNTLLANMINAWKTAFPNSVNLTAPNWTLPGKPVCSVVNKTRGISGIYIADGYFTSIANGAPSGIGVSGVQYAMVDSFDPDIFSENCANTYFIAQASSSQLQTAEFQINALLSTTLTSVVRAQGGSYLGAEKTLISIGGAGYGIQDWCPFLEPFFQVEYPDMTCEIIENPSGGSGGQYVPICHSFKAESLTFMDNATRGKVNMALVYNDTDIFQGNISCACVQYGYTFDAEGWANGTDPCGKKIPDFQWSICNASTGSASSSNGATNCDANGSPGAYTYYVNYNPYGWNMDMVENGCCCAYPRFNVTNVTVLVNGVNKTYGKCVDGSVEGGAVGGGVVNSCNWTMSSTTDVWGIGLENAPTNKMQAYIQGWLFLLGYYNLAGIDLDFETFDTYGYMAAGLTEFARQMRIAMPSVVLSLTVMAGPNNGVPSVDTFSPSAGNGYTPFFNCLGRVDCPFSMVVPMLYDVCMYPLRNQMVGPGDGSIPDPCMDYTGGFTLEGLVELWENALYGCTRTSLVFGITTQQNHSTGRTPCSAGLNTIDYLYNHSDGMYFWQVPSYTNPGFLNSATGSLVNYYLNKVGGGSTLPPSPPGGGGSGTPTPPTTPATIPVAPHCPPGNYLYISDRTLQPADFCPSYPGFCVFVNQVIGEEYGAGSCWVAVCEGQANCVSTDNSQYYCNTGTSNCSSTSPSTPIAPSLAPLPTPFGPEGPVPPVRAIYMDYAGFPWNGDWTDVLQQIHSSGYTHLILAFFIPSAGGYNGTDAVSAWVDTFRAVSSVPTGLKIMMSIGGGTVSPDFTDISSATAYGTAAGTYAGLNGFDGMDFDIEGMIPDWDNNNPIPWIVEITKAGIEAFYRARGIMPIVSHAPQGPHFTSAWTLSGTKTYLNIETEIGVNITFYNVQFYNQGDYCYTTSLGLQNQSSYDCGSGLGVSSVREITAAGLNYTKLVVGKIFGPDDGGSGWLTGNGIGILMGSTPYGGIMGWKWKGDVSLQGCAVLLGFPCVEGLGGSGLFTNYSNYSLPRPSASKCFSNSVIINSTLYATLDNWNKSDGGTNGGQTAFLYLPENFIFSRVVGDTLLPAFYYSWGASLLQAQGGLNFYSKRYVYPTNYWGKVYTQTNCAVLNSSGALGVVIGGLCLSNQTRISIQHKPCISPRRLRTTCPVGAVSNCR